jgi:hypothetical protein
LANPTSCCDLDSLQLDFLELGRRDVQLICIVPGYHFFCVDTQGHITGTPARVECSDDADAIAKAVALLDRNVIEVWLHGRRVKRLVPYSRAAAINKQ